MKLSRSMAFLTISITIVLVIIILMAGCVSPERSPVAVPQKYVPTVESLPMPPLPPTPVFRASAVQRLSVIPAPRQAPVVKTYEWATPFDYGNGRPITSLATVVETSPNLRDWTEVARFPYQAGSKYSYTVTNDYSKPACFLRTGVILITPK
jgi:hypothetical protein